MLKKQTSTRKLPIFDCNDGIVAVVNPLSNSSTLDAAGSELETRYLLSELVNATHLFRSIEQHQLCRQKLIFNSK